MMTKAIVCLATAVLMSCSSTEELRSPIDGDSQGSPTTSRDIIPREPVALFSPYDDVQEAIHSELQKVNASVHCSLFGISNKTLAGDLEALARLGKDVRVGIDHRQAEGRHDLHEELQAAGVKVEIKPKHALEHNKFCILDDKHVIMGSWNWSAGAQLQDNSNLIFIDNQRIADKFEQAFQRIWQRDRPQDP
jgi:mitochondrial cardiolipin hydrolase